MSRRAREARDSEPSIPWTTGALVCLCVVGFALVQTRALEIEASAEAQLTAAEAFFEARPYLSLPPLLEARIDPVAASQLAADYERQRARIGSGPRPAGLVAQEQRELDALTGLVGDKLSRRPERRFGLRARARDPLGFAAHAFLHVSPLHAALSLLLLALLGGQLERRWGTPAMLGVASASLVGSAALFVLQRPADGEPLIGCSGLLAGLLGALVVSYLRAPRPAYAVPLLVAGGLALVAPPLLGHEWSIARGLGAAPAAFAAWNPSAWALLGGFGAGTAIALGLRGLGIPLRGLPTQARADGPSQAASLELDWALTGAGGAPEDSARRLEAILRRDPDHEAASLAYWDVCDALARPGDAVPFLLRVLREDVRRGNDERVLHYWLALARCDLDGEAEPALLLRMAGLLRDAGEDAIAARALRHALSQADGANAASVSARVAREAERIDPETARVAAWQALGSVDIDLEERQSLEALLGRIIAEHGVRNSQRPQHEPDAEYRPAAVQAAQPTRSARPASGGIAIEALERDLELVDALPVGFDDTGLLIEADGARKRVRYDRIQAVAVAAVDGLSAKTVIVIDLVLNWMSLSDEPLRVIRLRTDKFAPRRLAEGERDALAAVRALTRRLVDAASATPLPDLQSISGMPFVAFKSVHDYQRDVLVVDSGEQ